MTLTTFSSGDRWWEGCRAKQRKHGYKLQTLPTTSASALLEVGTLLWIYLKEC